MINDGNYDNNDEWRQAGNVNESKTQRSVESLDF